MNHSVQRTAYSVQRTAYSVQRTAYSVQRTAYSVHCTLYSVQCTAYSVQRTAYSVHCTVSTCTVYKPADRLQDVEPHPDATNLLGDRPPGVERHVQVVNTFILVFFYSLKLLQNKF